MIEESWVYDITDGSTKACTKALQYGNYGVLKTKPRAKVLFMETTNGLITTSSVDAKNGETMHLLWNLQEKEGSKNHYAIPTTSCRCKENANKKTHRRLNDKIRD